MLETIPRPTHSTFMDLAHFPWIAAAAHGLEMAGVATIVGGVVLATLSTSAS